jgi:hypothetical protein
VLGLFSSALLDGADEVNNICAVGHSTSLSALSAMSYRQMVNVAEDSLECRTASEDLVGQQADCAAGWGLARVCIYIYWPEHFPTSIC